MPRLEDASGVWFNVFDKDDPIGYPLKCLNEAYRSVVTGDVFVGTGLFGLSHTGYFKSRDVHRLIAERL